MGYWEVNRNHIFKEMFIVSKKKRERERKKGRKKERKREKERERLGSHCFRAVCSSMELWKQCLG